MKLPVAVLPVLGMLAAGCAVEPGKVLRRVGPPMGPSSLQPAAVQPRALEPAAVHAVEAPARCSELAALEAEPALPGAPAVEARRAETFARAKANPVLFLRSPVATPIAPEADALRRSIIESPDPVKTLYELYPTFQKRPDLARQALLTDGYLFDARPFFASALTNLVRVEDLFVERRAWLERGSTIWRLDRKSSGRGPYYVYGEGPESGMRVKLLLFDRLATDEKELETPLHVDVGPVAKELGFTEMRVGRITEHGMVADLRYGDVWVKTALRREGARLSLACEMVPPPDAERVRSFREVARRKEHVLDGLRAVMALEVAEALPFDEPKTEVGQQDGKLRQNWVWAYRYGQTQFDFNDDKYRVFDAAGRPRVPQVCIDFITDTLERASGSWYRPRGEPRERLPGRLDFAALGIDNERSVESFIAFAKAHPEWFDVYELPDEERIPYAHRSEFFGYLSTHAEQYRPGDIVAIYGLRDDGKMHYHSFFVYDEDPVTGAPSLVAANAGRPRIRPWEAEMLTAPLRSIRVRIRPKLEWLESVTNASSTAADVPHPTTI